MNKITLKCWNRPIYLLNTLRSLMYCRNVSNYTLIISCDFFDTVCSQQILEAIQMSNIANTMEVQVEFHKSSLGCTGNTRYCLEESFKEGEDYTIHLEDDTCPAVDLLEYFEQVLPVMDRYFAACTFHRPCHVTGTNTQNDVEQLVSKKWFEGAGGFMITRARWEKILSMGGVFGVDYISDRGKEYDCVGKDWLKEVVKSDRLSWDWPFHKYFSQGLPSLYPKVGRVYNIGKSGLHTNFNQYTKIFANPDWIENGKYMLANPSEFNINNIEEIKLNYLEDKIVTEA